MLEQSAAVRRPSTPPCKNPRMAEELLEIADELYALPLPEFTPARDRKAKELKGTDLAKEVKALKKPSLAAWVVNLLVRHEAEQVEQVLQVGAALRKAQESMSGDELRQLTRQRRQVTAAVTTQARRLSREHGQKITEAVAGQVEATLTAAMIDEECAKAVRSGMLLTPLESTGVDAVELDRAVALPEALGFVASVREPAAPTKPELHVVPDPDRDEKALAAAREALEQAEGELTEATEAYDDADTAVKELEARSMQVQAEIDELKRKIAELEESADEVDEESAAAEEARDEAEAVVTEATEARDAAAKAVKKLER
jgi:DNA repair exonuclease SbcCD ATPase subunit